MQENIKKILEIAANAPSGSNSQPWQFKVKDNQIYVIAQPEKDHPILNYRYRGTWIAHGALIENIIITASSFGYDAKARIFPDQSQPNLTAVITLTAGLPKSDPLFSVIPLRTTNRKPYKDKLLSREEKQEFLDAAPKLPGIEVKLFEDKEKRRLIGEALAINEVVTLENPKLHKLFFEEILWSRAEEAAKKSGFYIKTMELKPPQQLVLRMLRNWQIMRLFNYLKFARVIAKGNAKIYSSGAGIGAIIVNDEDKDFLLAGSVMERLWLKATQMRLNFHLITGTMFFWQRIQANAGNIFSPRHIEIINKAYSKITGALNVDKGIVALVFRIGFDGEPSALSSKKLPKIIWE